MTEEQADFILLVLSISKDKCLHDSCENKEAWLAAKNIVDNYRIYKQTLGFEAAAHKARKEFLMSYLSDK